MIVLESNTWGGLGIEGRRAWQEFLKAHDLEPRDIGFPLEVDDEQDPPVMHLWILLRDEHGHRYQDPPGEVAVREETMLVRHPLPQQRPEVG